MRHAWMYLTMGALTGPLGVLGAQEQAPLLDRIRAAVNLPAIVDSVRHHGGISEEDMRTVMGDVMQRRVPANETRDMLAEADSAIREHGPVDNFGAFVQAQLAAGLRGKALAQAIRQEHQRRGIGKGKQIEPKGGPAARDSAGRGRGEAAPQRGAKPESPGSQGRGGRDTTKRKGRQ